MSKIMVVDDNSATRRMVRNALQRKGHEVLEAPDAKTARELMASERPRVVLQDLMLPDADGFELVNELRELAGGDEVAILAFSGFVSELDEAHASTVGFDDIIPKPIAPSRLVPLVEAHLPLTVPQSGQFGQGRRVVVADDDPMQLKLAAFKLARLGFEVETATDGYAALAASRRKQPDIIVSDVMMPELDGFGLAMEVRKDPQLGTLPLVLMTSSYVEPADRDLARRAGANDMVSRTPELVELVEAMRTSLATPAPKPAIGRQETFLELEREHTQRVLRQLERQVTLNAGLAKRCSALASELMVLTGISEAVLKHRDVDVALDEAIAECFDAGGIALGALYLRDAAGLRVRVVAPGAGEEQLPSFFGHPALLEDLLERRAVLRVPSGTQPADVERELLARAQASGLLVVPLQLEGVQGCMLMVARGHDLDGEDWDAFAHGLATQISQVLSLAHAYAEREAAERKATEHAALLDAVLESAPDRVMHVALDGTVLFVNRAPGNLLAQDYIGMNLFAHDQAYVQPLRDAFDRVLATGEPSGFEASIIGADRTPVWYSTRIGPIKQDGKVTSVVLVARDVTASKQTEMHLMLADRMASVGTLAAGVAHEINNPLASVIANLDMAIEDIGRIPVAQLPGDLAEELEDARHAADRVREIVRDLKIFSRTEEDTRGPVDVEAVLESTLRLAWNELRHRARLVKHYGKVPRIEGNESRLGQVFLNLIINAVHAMPLGQFEHNELRIATSVDGGNIVVAIADTGSGIPPEVRPRLFTPFFTTKPVGVGTGLGLAISHRIVTQFGGTIAFDSEVGRGTEFRVTLPVHAPAPVPAPPATTLKIPVNRRGRVLVVDDEEPLAGAVRRFLAQDHDVTAVYSARAALDLLERGERYDVVLCDLMMPQMTGMDLHAALDVLDPAQAARVVFVTGGAFTPSAREFLETVPNRRLEKPFDLKVLRKLVASLVR